MPDPAKSPLLLQDSKLDRCDQARVHQGLVVGELAMGTINIMIASSVEVTRPVFRGNSAF